MECLAPTLLIFKVNTSAPSRCPGFMIYTFSCDGHSTMARFTRNAAPPADLLSKRAARAPSMPAEQLPRTIIQQQAKSRGRWAAPQTKTSLAPSTTLSPAPLPRAHRSPLIGILRRKLGCGYLFVQRPPRFESPTPAAVRPPKGKVLRKFLQASRRSQQLKTRSRAASQKCATPASRRESVPRSSDSRWPPLDRSRAVPARWPPGPSADPKLCAPPGASRTLSPATAADRSPAQPLASNHPCARS